MTQKEEYNKRIGKKKDAPNSKTDISKKTKIPKKILDEVYDRGIGAHKENPASVRLKGSFKKDPKAPLSKKLPAEQWGMARVYSFVNKVEGKRKLNHDRDLLDKIPKLKGKNKKLI